MDPTLRAVLGVCVRWIHIASIATLIGGFFYARFIFVPAAASLSAADRESLSASAAKRFLPWIITLVVAALASGTYNYAMKGVYPPTYHMWMGIKILIALHIFSSAILYAMRGDESKRRRNAMSVVIFGWIVIAIAGYLRYLSSK
jgi:uncharacterized membrane protein